MAKADSLRFHEVRDVYRLIGDCRDLGSNPILWQTRLLEGLGQLIGVRALTGGEGVYAGARQQTSVTSFVMSGLETGERNIVLGWYREVGPDNCPIFCAFKRHRGRAVIRDRKELVSDHYWYQSASFLCREGTAIPHPLTSMVSASDRPTFSVVSAHARSPRDFRARQRRLMHFLHEEIAPLIGRSLISSTEPGPSGLSPRLRQTLVCLLEGDSEKQVAARLRISQATTHQYVTALYRHFAVQSRAQLLALVLRRLAHRSWRHLIRDVGSPNN